jgi:hypothetical protein
MSWEWLLFAAIFSLVIGYASISENLSLKTIVLMGLGSGIGGFFGNLASGSKPWSEYAFASAITVAIIVVGGLAGLVWKSAFGPHAQQRTED